MDAVLTHAVANGLIAVVVLVVGEWSLWAWMDAVLTHAVANGLIAVVVLVVGGVVALGLK